MASTQPRPRTAIVTGAAQGIGRAIALRLAEAGFDISVNDLPSNVPALTSLVEEIESKGRKAIFVTGDVSQEQDIQTLVDRSVAELGDLYVMVANAGIASVGEPIVNMTLQTWERFMAINLTGVFLCYRAAAQQMLKQGRGGRIIGASSAYGKQGWPGAAPYCTTKFGVRGLTQSLAGELAKDGITVNAYAPGFIDTVLLREAFRVGVDASLPESEKEDASNARLEASIKKTPVQKIGTPENIAALVAYMVSEEADFMTGQSVSVNGGIFYD